MNHEEFSKYFDERSTLAKNTIQEKGLSPIGQFTQTEEFYNGEGTRFSQIYGNYSILVEGEDVIYSYRNQSSQGGNIFIKHSTDPSKTFVEYSYTKRTSKIDENGKPVEVYEGNLFSLNAGDKPSARYHCLSIEEGGKVQTLHSPKAAAEEMMPEVLDGLLIFGHLMNDTAVKPEGYNLENINVLETIKSVMLSQPQEYFDKYTPSTEVAATTETSFEPLT